MWGPQNTADRSKTGKLKDMKRIAAIFTVALVCAALAVATQPSQQSKFPIAPGGVVNVVATSGSVTLHQGSQRQVAVTTTTHSDKVEVDVNNTPDGKRIDIRTHN